MAKRAVRRRGEGGGERETSPCGSSVSAFAAWHGDEGYCQAFGDIVQCYCPRRHHSLPPQHPNPPRVTLQDIALACAKPLARPKTRAEDQAQATGQGDEFDARRWRLGRRWRVVLCCVSVWWLQHAGTPSKTRPTLARDMHDEPRSGRVHRRVGYGVLACGVSRLQ